MITPNFSSGPQGLTQFSGNCEVSLCKQQKVLCMAKNIQTHTKQNQNQQVEVKQMSEAVYGFCFMCHTLLHLPFPPADLRPSLSVSFLCLCGFRCAGVRPEAHRMTAAP